MVLLLTVTVGAVMLGASYLALREREAALQTALSDELRAHAVTLQMALEENYQNSRIDEAQKLINRLSENSRVYGVLLFDERGELRSKTQRETEVEFRQPPELARVLETGESIEFVRTIQDRKFLSIILPLRLSPDGAERGAVEIVKPLALIERAIARARLDRLTTTVLLLAAIFIVVYVVLRRGLSRPVSALLSGARALGSGDLSHRVPVPATGNELTLLAAEFNRMADSIENQRDAIRAEGENRYNLERQLRHSARLASVGRLAAGIAHELGAPLNVIDARAQQLIEKPDAPREKQVKNLTAIRNQTGRITHIVRQLLNLARPYDLHFEPVNLNNLVASSLEGIDSDSKLKIEMDAREDFKIYGDADFLRQVFVNVLQNAVHAMPDGGNIHIEIFEIIRGGKNFAAVKITDTGGGIGEADLEKIFDPFYTTKDIGKGTGLGLAVSHRIVEEHGGAIEALNAKAGGASFAVYLPVIANI